MKVPNEPGLSPNNGLENVSLSDQSMASNPRKGQAKCRFLQPSLPDALPAVRMVLAETQAELSPAKIEARLEMPCLRSWHGSWGLTVQSSLQVGKFSHACCYKDMLSLLNEV